MSKTRAGWRGAEGIPVPETSFSLGARFLAAREALDLPLEQAAHETRIRVQRLREIESDDFSHFSHPSYARMFLIDYAKYLRIPVEEIRDLLPSGGSGGSEGYQYLEESNERVLYRPIRPARQRRLMPVLVGAVAAIILVVGGFELAVTLRKIDRLKTTEAAAQVAVVSPERIAMVSPVEEAVKPAARPAVIGAPPVGANVAIDEAVINSDESLLQTESAIEATAPVTEPSPAPAAPATEAATSPASPVSPTGAAQSSAPASPLFVGGTVERSNVQ